MGLFGFSKIKITPNEFIRRCLDRIFSIDFKATERKNFYLLCMQFPILDEILSEDYVKELQNVVFNLFKIAWDRNAPGNIAIEYAYAMSNDPRVKEIDNEAYDFSLSKAQEASMRTFEYISKVFLTMISPHGTDINAAGNMDLVEFLEMNFTDIYMN